MKILIILLTVFFVSPSLANWTYITRTPEASLYIYISPDAYGKTGPNTFRFWKLYDMDKNAKYDFKSFRVLSEIDCKEKKERNIQITSFGSSMGAGKVVRVTNDISDWNFIAPDSLDDIGRKTLCKNIFPTLK